MQRSDDVRGGGVSQYPREGGQSIRGGRGLMMSGREGGVSKYPREGGQSIQGAEV